ncbi:MAG: OmpA family protein, partial [Candidatus Scalindua sp.]
ETKEPLDATIELYDLGAEEPISIFTSDPVTGKYYTILNENRKIALYIDREGYLFQSQSFDLSNEHSNSIDRDIYLKPIKKGNSVRLNNLFFEFNSALLTADSKTELNKIIRFLINNPLTKIEISGHTDDQGTEEYNLNLSKERAKAVYSYLIDHQININNLTFTGYGEAQPIASNDDENGRELNRRIKFEISN